MTGFDGLGGIIPDAGKAGGQASGQFSSHETTGSNAPGFDPRYDPNLYSIGLICVQIAEQFAFQPMEGHISDLSLLEDQTTSLETGLNSMSNMMSYLMQNAAPGIGIDTNSQQYQTLKNSFIGSFKNIYETGQPSNPTLNSLSFTFRVQGPDGKITTVTYPASDFGSYWTKWQASANSNIPGFGDKMITTDGGTHVSGMQLYMARYIQSQLDSEKPIQLNGQSPQDALNNLLNNQTGSPLYPSFNDTSNLAIKQLWSVASLMPSAPTNVPTNLYHGTVPTKGLLQSLLDGDSSQVDANFQWMAWVHHNSGGIGSQLNSSQSWVKSNNVTDTASSWLQNVNQAETTVNTTSQTLTQQIQELSSELNVIDNAVAKIIESFSQLIQAIVSSYKSS